MGKIAFTFVKQIQQLVFSASQIAKLTCSSLNWMTPFAKLLSNHCGRENLVIFQVAKFKPLSLEKQHAPWPHRKAREFFLKWIKDKHINIIIIINKAYQHKHIYLLGKKSILVTSKTCVTSSLHSAHMSVMMMITQNILTHNWNYAMSNHTSVFFARLLHQGNKKRETVNSTLKCEWMTEWTRRRERFLWHWQNSVSFRIFRLTW